MPPEMSATEFSNTADKGRVLVVDDELDIREGLDTLLTLEGYSVDLAPSGTEGVRKLESRAYDMVLLDLMMPDRSGMDVLREPGPDAPRDVLLLGAGPMALMCLAAAERLADHGIGVTVVDPRWLKPVDEAVVDAARRHRLVAVVEDNGRVGGYGDAVSRLLRDRDVDVPVKTFGLPQEFLTHGDRGEVLAEAGLTPQHLARQITEAVARRASAEVITPPDHDAERDLAAADAITEPPDKQ